MIPIRLGTVGILRLVASMGLVNSLLSLILVYTAQGLPLAIFVLQQFMTQVPPSLKEAARVDGASEYRIFGLVLPLVRPAVATVAVFVMIPIWNDLWFPLILAPSEATKTITLGTQQFLGQFVSDWNAVLASLTLAMCIVFMFNATAQDPQYSQFYSNLSMLIGSLGSQLPFPFRSLYHA